MSTEDKEFDGIKQADNEMPYWWKLFFVLAIFFAIGYSIYFFGFSKWRNADHFRTEVAEHEKKFPKKQFQKNQDGSNPLRGNAEAIAAGAKTFKNICATCHGAEAKGDQGIGPNLTDSEWIHGDYDDAIFTTIMEGIKQENTKLGKGAMPAHKDSIGEEGIYQIMAWIAEKNPSLKKVK
ncbi:MAG: c-type cytochrome [Leptospiraceae bacterium]|nr:c-type cytochrome [Leptospiraceae bacterium]MCP5495512.1 c-type cytochrome [Leptospiraceae bacterium]